MLDATKAFALELTDPAEVAGLPLSAKRGAAHAAARAANREPAADAAERGPWRVTLDGPSYIPFMEHATRRDLREKLYRGFVTRASAGELNNQPLIDRILIEVEDECGGLPDRRAEELFRPFEQRSSDRTGLGLGLSISRRAVQANDGTLGARSLPGKGCVFTIDLPRSGGN